MTGDPIRQLANVLDRERIPYALIGAAPIVIEIQTAKTRLQHAKDRADLAGLAALPGADEWGIGERLARIRSEP